MPRPEPAGDLAKVKRHDADETWPAMVEIVCWFGPTDNPRKGKRRFIEIPADQFFGFGAFGAPLTGDVLIGMVDRLRRSK